MSAEFGSKRERPARTLQPRLKGLPDLAVSSCYVRTLIGLPKMAVPLYDAAPYDGHMVCRGAGAGAVYGPVVESKYIPPDPSRALCPAGFVAVRFRNPFQVTDGGPEYVWANVWTTLNKKGEKMGKGYGIAFCEVFFAEPEFTPAGPVPGLTVDNRPASNPESLDEVDVDSDMGEDELAELMQAKAESLAMSDPYLDQMDWGVQESLKEHVRVQSGQPAGGREPPAASASSSSSTPWVGALIQPVTAPPGEIVEGSNGKVYARSYNWCV